jgi:hypothetical protein
MKPEPVEYFDPTPNDRKLLLRLYKNARSRENFADWFRRFILPDAKKPRVIKKPAIGARGREPLDDRASFFLQRCALQYILAARDGVRPTDALRQYLVPLHAKLEGIKPGTYAALGLGKNVEATIHRVNRKLRTEDIPEDEHQALLQLVSMRPPLEKTRRRTKRR